MTMILLHETEDLARQGTESTMTQEANTSSPSEAEAPPEGPGIVSWVVLALLVFALIRWRKGLAQGASTAIELLAALWKGPNWWLVPVVVLLLPAAIILVLLQTVPVVAPFVYTVF